MPRAKKATATERIEPPATTYEGREQQLIALATNLAEKKLLDGTASSPVIVHYLKLGTTRERLEQEKIRHENNMLEAKRAALESQRHSDELYQEALKMFRVYSGYEEEENYDD